MKIKEYHSTTYEYIAEDGKSFSNKDQCLEYEKLILSEGRFDLIKSKIKELEGWFYNDAKKILFTPDEEVGNENIYLKFSPTCLQDWVLMFDWLKLQKKDHRVIFYRSFYHYGNKEWFDLDRFETRQGDHQITRWEELPSEPVIIVFKHELIDYYEEGFKHEVEIEIYTQAYMQEKCESLIGKLFC